MAKAGCQPIDGKPARIHRGLRRARSDAFHRSWACSSSPSLDLPGASNGGKGAAPGRTSLYVSKLPKCREASLQASRRGAVRQEWADRWGPRDLSGRHSLPQPAECAIGERAKLGLHTVGNQQGDCQQQGAEDGQSEEVAKWAELR